MTMRTMSRPAAFAAGCCTLALTAGGGIASAGPDDAAINSPCTYSQAVAAINDQSPDAAALFNSTPIAQQFLQTFITAPPPERAQLLQQARGVPQAAQFVSLIGPIAATCQNYPID